MKSGLYSLRPMVLALVCVLTLPRSVRAQDGETAPPRDTLIAAARQIMESAHFCALITLDKSGHPRARAMDPFSPEDDMTVWLGTNRRTRKVQDIKNDERVTLFYLDPNAKGYVSLYGTARVVDDPQETARRCKTEWSRFYPDKEQSYILIEVKPSRLEVVNYERGVIGDPTTWKPPSIEFTRK
jgi:general stress protein 26